MAELLQFAGSLAAIALLVWAVRVMRLGASSAFSGDGDVRQAAALAADDFAAVDIAIGRDGYTALLADEEGRVLVLRAHGAHHASRLVGPGARAWLEGGYLHIDPADRRFGCVKLFLAQPEDWLNRINSL